MVRRDTDFSAWADEHTPTLARFATALTGESESGGSLVREALSRSYAVWPTFGSGDDPAMYARRVMLHAHVVDDSRRPRGRAAPAADDAVGDDRLWAALQRLPAKQRAVLVARDCEGRTDAETSALLGWSLGTVRSQADKARAQLAPSIAKNDVGTDDLAAALRDRYERIDTRAEPSSLIGQAVNHGTTRRRRDLQRRGVVFVAVCAFALAGMVSLSRGGRRIPRFGGALVTAPAAQTLSRNLTPR